MSECICKGFAINKRCQVHGYPEVLIASEKIRIAREYINEENEKLRKRLKKAEKVIEFYSDIETKFSAGLEMNSNIPPRDGSEDGYVEESGFLAREYQQKYMSEDSDE